MNDNEVRIHQNPVIPNKECYVAFLDLLGFHEIIDKWEPSKIKEMFEELFNAGNLLKSCRATPLGYNSIKSAEYFNSLHENLFIYIMSDSIVLAIENSNERNLHFLLYTCDFIQKYFFEQYSVILRGGVSVGWFYGKGPIAFGKGFVNAHYLEDKKAIYPRVIIDEKSEKILEDACNDWPYQIHKESDYCSVDWLYNINMSYDEIKSICNKNIIEHDKQEQESVRKKYQWILDRICHKKTDSLIDNIYVQLLDRYKGNRTTTIENTL